MRQKLFVCALTLVVLASACKPERPALTRVRDSANLLQPAEQDSLQVLLERLSATGPDFRVYLEPDLNGRDASDVALELARLEPLGEPGVNNGALILIAQKERVVKILCETGLEWAFSDSASGDLIEEMRPDLAAGRYFPALKLGFNTIARQSQGLDWLVSYRTMEEIFSAQENAKGKIAAISGRVGEKVIPADWLETQFNPNLTAEVATEAGDTLSLQFSKYMAEMVEDHFGQTHIWFFRVQSLDPVKGQLLGVQ